MTKEIDLHIGRRLRRRRRVLGLTQQQLGERMNIRFQQVQKYECGANRVSAARLWYLARALEIDVGYFYDGFVDNDEGYVGLPDDSEMVEPRKSTAA